MLPRSMLMMLMTRRHRNEQQLEEWSIAELQRKQRKMPTGTAAAFGSRRWRRRPFETLHIFLLLLVIINTRTLLTTHALAIADTGPALTAGANLTDLGTTAPKYQTAYACEGKKLTIECEPGDLINLIRANYGRFSITICNDHGNVEWSVNCMFPRSLTVLNSRCAHKQSCSVLATTSMFSDPCPGTHKYLEAHYQCISAAQTSTTTNRPSPPPWVMNNSPPLLANASTIIGNAAVDAVGGTSSFITRLPILPGVVGINDASSHNNATASTKHGNIHSSGSAPTSPQQHHHHHSAGGGGHHSSESSKTAAAEKTISADGTSPTNTRILTGVGGTGSNDDAVMNGNRGNQQQQQILSSTTTITLPTVSTGNYVGIGGSGVRTINNININAGLIGDDDESKMFCPPTNARNLFWNITRIGDVNVQPCPGGAAGIAKWRCVPMKRISLEPLLDDIEAELAPGGGSTLRPQDCQNGSLNCEYSTAAMKPRNYEAAWHPMTPDLTQCRSLWLNNLEMRVNQRDSSLISIANDLSEVTSSKTLYGGDMLVTAKIIQTMADKMFHDKETFPDQRQREAIIMELLHGVVKTGSNLLDESQLTSWLDLSPEDQMRVATLLLTGLEYNAFLLADTIIRERNVVQKVKNILLSVRVLETKNIQGNEIFPDAEQWPLSNDRIELPRAALLENSEGGLVRIVFAAFDRLESILKPSYDYFDIKTARSYVRNTALLTNDSENAEQRLRILNSKVISASLGKGRHIQLSQPIRLVLKHLKTENVTNPTCVFWNYIDHAWSANGCSLEATNRTHSVCKCNHLTNFAIVADVIDEHQHSLFTMFDSNMRIFIYLSVGFCVLFIVVSLLSLKLWSGAFIKSTRTTIYRNIYLCLLITELLFLVGIEQIETSTVCGFVTVFLHCAILSAISWFCYEAYHSYASLTSDEVLLEVGKSPKLKCYYLLSYSMAFLVVTVACIINPSSYTLCDFCILMEENSVFYTTFALPIVLFFIGAVVYTLLSCLILRRRNRTSLKTKEHARLVEVRFDVRCSFIFLLILSGVWCSAYLYIRRTKLDDHVAVFYGYCFLGLNTLMGFYIFITHCIQNDKVCNEYRRYVRQQSWLPRCLRCSKTSIASAVACGSGSASGVQTGHNGAGTLNNCTTPQQHIMTPNELVNANEHVVTAGDDAIIASSDCELNEQQAQAQKRLKSTGVLAGTMVSQQQQLRAAGVQQPPNQMSGTLRSTGGGAGSSLHTPSAGHTSPTSSAGSTHLIFANKQQQQMQSMVNVPQEAYYHQPDYYSWKQSQQAIPRDVHYFNSGPPPAQLQQQQQQAHEVFYWTQKHNGHGKKKRLAADAQAGSLQNRSNAASSQMVFYPSYKKTNMKGQQQQQHPHYAEAIEPSPHGYYPQQQPLPSSYHPRHTPRHMPHAQQQQQQLSSDEEQMESAAHARLLQMQRRAGSQQLPAPPPHIAQFQQELMANAAAVHGPMMDSRQRYYRNKHSNCDLNRDYEPATAASDSYYNHGDGPVYEEILSNRTSDVQHYEVGDFDVDEVYNNSVGAFGGINARNSRFGASGGSVGGSVSSRSNIKPASQLQQKHQQRRGTADDDDDESGSLRDDESDLDDDSHGLPVQSDERMRRLMALQDKDFERRFQRQLRKNGAPIDYNAAMQQQQLQLQQQQLDAKNNTVFGISGDVGEGASLRSYKKHSPSGARLAVNELFNHQGAINISGGPPLPPVNHQQQQQLQQTPGPKQRQLSKQPISPQSTTSSSSSPNSAQNSHSHQMQLAPTTTTTQQPRNISAMLDENNTVRCYLEPLPK